MLIPESHVVFLGLKLTIGSKLRHVWYQNFQGKTSFIMLQRIVGYNDNRRYFGPVNISMAGNIKIFHATTRPDRFSFAKMSDDLDFIKIEKF